MMIILKKCEIKTQLILQNSPIFNILQKFETITKTLPYYSLGVDGETAR